LNYQKVVALSIDPIEKKPLFHFLPGTHSLSLASPGCNFSCSSCQNWMISQGPRLTGQVKGEELEAKKIVQIALKNQTPSISYTYTEPTIFLEYSLEIMKLAKEQGVKNVWVTNGFFSEQTLELIKPYLDAMNIDLKGFSNDFYQQQCGARIQPVLDNLKKVVKNKIWLEITTLVIPGLNDDPKTLKKIAEFIKKELGPDVPWHITRFSGSISWKLKHLPNTSLEKLVQTYQIGKNQGLNHVYIGNVPGIEQENTFCPKCGALVIKRIGYLVERKDKKGSCPQCKTRLKIIDQK
jgi:pyruvate formate lyase activating enzyme